MNTRYSVNKLNRIAKKREIWCWGTGFQYGRMIKNYESEEFARKIAGVIDTNDSIQGTTRVINGKEMIIVAPEDAFKDKTKKYLLIISCDAYNSVYKQATKMFADVDIVYTGYPRNYYCISENIKKICCKLPLKRQLLFYVGTGTSQPHENAKEIVRYLKEEYTGKPYKIVFLTDSKDIVPDGVKQISLDEVRCKTSFRDLVKYHYYYCTSKFLFYESGPIGKVRQEQKTIYLNHGTIPLKYVKDALKQPSSLDFAVCPGPGCKKLYEEQYGVPKEKQILMMPARVREIFVDKFSRVDEIFELKNKNMILWLPTFRRLERGDKSLRKDSNKENPVIELLQSENAILLNEQLAMNNQKLIVKCHPREKEAFSSNRKMSNIIITTNELLAKEGLCTHNLMNRADALISDYSGVTFEYFLLDRPTGYYIPDIDNYTRGFSVTDPMHYMPGEKIYTVNELMEFLVGLKEGHDKFAIERRTLVKELFDNVDPKNGAKELVDFLDRN